uniref:PH domain-containing protein n=1 Tax=Anisakis simplex TaxID=6269 RepID=A0A0M3J2X9_ANISI
LYGHICCRIVAQPNSVVMPLSEGVLTVSSLDEDRCYEGVRCRLQNSKILSSRYAKSLIVTSDRHVPNGRHQKHYLLIADSEEDIAAWRHAFSLQISDCERWGEFAICPVKLTSEPRATEPATLSRANGRRLYDEIQINDGQWNGFTAFLTYMMQRMLNSLTHI